MSASIITKLIAAYDEYVDVLGKSESSLLGIAVSHGCGVPEHLVRRGAELRAEIEKLKAELRDA